MSKRITPLPALRRLLSLGNGSERNWRFEEQISLEDYLELLAVAVETLMSRQIRKDGHDYTGDNYGDPYPTATAFSRAIEDATEIIPDTEAKK